jgi:hypothetical protein
MVATLARTQEGLDGRDTMSALGHKRTFAVQKVMSGLPPKADIRRQLIDVRFVPIADIFIFQFGLSCFAF